MDTIHTVGAVRASSVDSVAYNAQITADVVAGHALAALQGIGAPVWLILHLSVPESVARREGNAPAPQQSINKATLIANIPNRSRSRTSRLLKV